MADLKQLAIVLEQAGKKEQQAMQMLVEAKQQVQQMEQQLAGLMQYRIDYLTDINKQGQQGLSASNMRQLQQFVGRMDQALEQQQQKIGQAKQALTSRQTAWQEARRQVQSIEFLMEQRRQQQAAREAKQEQKLQDEFTTIQFARKQLDNQ